VAQRCSAEIGMKYYSSSIDYWPEAGVFQSLELVRNRFYYLVN